MLKEAIAHRRGAVASFGFLPIYKLSSIFGKFLLSMRARCFRVTLMPSCVRW